MKIAEAVDMKPSRILFVTDVIRGTSSYYTITVKCDQEQESCQWRRVYFAGRRLQVAG